MAVGGLVGAAAALEGLAAFDVTSVGFDLLVGPDDLTSADLVSVVLPRCLALEAPAGACFMGAFESWRLWVVCTWYSQQALCLDHSLQRPLSRTRRKLESPLVREEAKTA